MTNEEKEQIEAVADLLAQARCLTRAAHHVRSAGRFLCGLKFEAVDKASLVDGFRGVTDDLSRQVWYSVDKSRHLIEQALSGKGEPDVKPEPDEPPVDEPTAIEAFQAIIKEHIDHAIAKHPLFAHDLCDRQDSYVQSAQVTQTAVKAQLTAGCVYADTLLFEEVYEFLAEVQAGNLATAKEEAGDVAAVLYRIIQMMEERK